LYYRLNSTGIFDNFSSKFLFKSVSRQLVTFTRILVAKYFFHSPWRPKWLQLGALQYLFNVLTRNCKASAKLHDILRDLSPALLFQDFQTPPTERTKRSARAMNNIMQCMDKVKEAQKGFKLHARTQTHASAE